MNGLGNDRELHRRIERDAQRLERAEREREGLLAQTVYLGTLGLVFVLPVVGGAYLGRWLDEMLAGYSMRWTLSLLFLGLVVGGFNVYFLIRSRD
ncbi:MAG: AtpZ/AtpI family protein [Thiocapsa sp.]|jgi:ATP synthase protein I|nr:AtpZ/AtpI family protein [Thiocapsa sp.]MCG6896125.1 AtpZ/AtpI family protein [Thiocapsa sp.]MCG6986398.1 AtpZ/AtpI family protein [Thiocapsa sp.]